MSPSNDERPSDAQPSDARPSDAQRAVCARTGPGRAGRALRRLGVAAGRPVPGRSLAVFRVVFGLIGLTSVVRLLAYGWVDSLYAGPARHFSYPGLSWLPSLPEPAMRVQLLVVAAAAVAVMVGYRYRLAIVVFWLGFSWMEFVEASVYLNHYWFITVMGALMIVLPMHATWSLDARRAQQRSVPDSSRSDPVGEGVAEGVGGTVAVGAVWLVRAQVGTVYCFAGLAKLHGDWLGRGLPLALWLPAKSDLPVVGELLAQLATARALSWAGALFDCTVVVFLLWRRTRPWAWLAVVAFHVATWVLFPIIGVFPWLMIGASTIFFDPDWPVRLWSRIRGSAGGAPSTPVAATPRGPGPDRVRRWRPARTATLVAAVLWMTVQVVLPVRYLLYPGDHRWTGEAYRFGWNVLLVEKAGDVVFRVTDTAAGTTSRTDATDLYTPQQWRTMVNEPELVRQAAHAVAAETAAELGVPVDRIEVRADAYVSFNGRPATRLVDPEVDLAAEPWRLGHQRWILEVPTSEPPER